MLEKPALGGSPSSGSSTSDVNQINNPKNGGSRSLFLSFQKIPPRYRLVLLIFFVLAFFLTIFLLLFKGSFVGIKPGAGSAGVEYDINSPQNVEKSVGYVTSLGADEKKVVAESFNKNWQTAGNEYERYGAYRQFYSSLRAKYNVTKDPNIFEQLTNLESFMSSQPQWKEYYDASKLDGGFL